MAGLVPAIHVLATKKKGVDARDKPGHDESVGTIGLPDSQRTSGGITHMQWPDLPLQGRVGTRYTAAAITTSARSCSRFFCERQPFMVAAKRSRIPSSNAVTMVSCT